MSEPREIELIVDVSEGFVLPMLDDRLVREMAERNHVPHELWARVDATPSLICHECRKRWPCPTRQALRRICTCPDMDVTGPGERLRSNWVKGYDDRCPVHGRRS